MNGVRKVEAYIPFLLADPQEGIPAMLWMVHPLLIRTLSLDVERGLVDPMRCRVIAMRATLQ